jgi:hypothetical protein
VQRGRFAWRLGAPPPERATVKKKWFVIFVSYSSRVATLKFARVSLRIRHVLSHAEKQVEEGLERTGGIGGRAGSPFVSRYPR